MSERPEIAPITATVKRFKEISGLGATSIYELIKSGDIRSVTFGRRRLIIMDSYREWLGRRETIENIATEYRDRLVSEEPYVNDPAQSTSRPLPRQSEGARRVARGRDRRPAPPSDVIDTLDAE